jgi:hypothetical protein
MTVLLVLALVFLVVVLLAVAIGFRSLELAIILYLICLIVFVAVIVRFSFIVYVVFDGAGPAEAIGESWRLSKRSAWRILGWGLLGGLVGGIASTTISALTVSISSSGQLALAQGVGGAAAQIGAVFTTFMMAVLYESERARKALGFYPGLPNATPQASPPTESDADLQTWRGVSAPPAYPQPVAFPAVPPVRRYADGSLPQDRTGTPDQPE